MIFYTITDTLPVVPDWSSITGDLKAGTPISIKGAVSNDEAAIGLVAGDTAHGAEYAVVVTAGVVDLNAASASYGSTVSDDVVQALDNVTFIYGGKVYAVTGSSLPDYSEASDGDVLSIDNGAPAWTTPSGGGEAAWNAMMKHMVFASLEATSNRSADVYVQCSDGILRGFWSASSDAETGDWSYSFGEWMTDPYHAVPNFEDYTATLEYNLGLILEDAFSESHDTDAMRCQEPIVVCRKFVLPED